MKVDTVNVIEYKEDTVENLFAFTNNEDGNSQAEEMFKTLATSHGCPDCDVESYVEDGHYTQNGWGVMLVHSI